jgi:hypothetical protein
MRGELVATYSAEEFFQANPRAEVFDTRLFTSCWRASPSSSLGRTVDLAEIAPRMTEL